jgi:two-component system NtrC family response regulator
LELVSGAQAPTACTLKEAREAAERDVIQNSLQRHRGKIAPAALELGISRPTLYELMEKLGINKKPSAEE